MLVLFVQDEGGVARFLGERVSEHCKLLIRARRRTPTIPLLTKTQNSIAKVSYYISCFTTVLDVHDTKELRFGLKLLLC